MLACNYNCLCACRSNFQFALASTYTSICIFISSNSSRYAQQSLSSAVLTMGEIIYRSHLPKTPSYWWRMSRKQSESTRQISNNGDHREKSPSHWELLWDTISYCQRRNLMHLSRAIQLLYLYGLTDVMHFQSADFFDGCCMRSCERWLQLKRWSQWRLARPPMLKAVSSHKSTKSKNHFFLLGNLKLVKILFYSSPPYETLVVLEINHLNI